MTESEFLAGEEPPAVSADADPARAGAPTDADPAAAGSPADADPGAAGSPADADPGATGADMDPDVEVVDGLPVLAEVRMVEHATAASLPAVQVAAVAATGFVAGAATVALVKRRTARKLARNGRSRPRRATDVLPIAATRSFLVDVHVIAKPGE